MQSSCREPSMRCTNPRASPTSASTPAPASGTTLSATTNPMCPTGWPTTWPRRADPGPARTTRTGWRRACSCPVRRRSFSTTARSTTTTTPASTPSAPGAVRYEWRVTFDNGAINALHAEGFGHPVLDVDWRSQVERHSLGWVCAFGANRLVGFVNVAWDGGVHAFVIDTLVARDRRHHGIGHGL